MTETNVATVLPVEEQITQELVKANVTEALIAGLKEKYLPLKINGIEDKETYLQVKEARKECKSLRVMAEKICKKGREEAVAIQKAWVAKEKEVAGQIGEVEDHLEKQEKEYEAEVEREKAERKRKQEEQFILRQQTLSSMGALYSDGNFVLGEISFELSLIKECETDIWEESILPKFKAEYQKIEAERLEQERIKVEKEAEFKRQQEELEQQKLELQRQQEALRKAQEEQDRKQREEEARKQVEENARIERLWRGRLEQLRPIGWNGQEAFAKYDESIIVITYDQLITLTDEAFDVINVKHQENVAKDAEEKEQKILAEIEAQKESERIKVVRDSRQGLLKGYGVTDWNGDIGLYTDEQWNALYEEVKDDHEKKQREKWEKEQEEKRKADELKKQLEMEQAKDKEKWDDILAQLNKLEIHEMRSGQYRKKSAILREKLDEIKAL